MHFFTRKTKREFFSNLAKRTKKLRKGWGMESRGRGKGEPFSKGIPSPFLWPPEAFFALHSFDRFDFGDFFENDSFDAVLESHL